MPVRIGSNISSLQAQRRLNHATEKISRVYRQLASGQRINGASDDPAGLAVSSKLSADARISNQGVRNLNDAISAANIADGALGALRDITIRQKELAEQAANGTYSVKQRQAMNREANLLVEEYNRITQSAKFNGLNLLDAGLGTIHMQAGASVISTGFSDSLARNIGNGTFQEGQYFGTIGNPDITAIATGDVNGDGYADIVTVNYYAVTLSIGNGDGSFRGPQTAASDFANFFADGSLALGDVNGDGKIDIVHSDYNGNILVRQGNGDGTFRAALSLSGSAFEVSLADMNNDGNIDIITSDFGSGSVGILLGNGNGTFGASRSFATGLGSASGLSIGDFDGDGKLDLSVVSGYDVAIVLGTGTGSFQSAKLVTINDGDVPRNIKIGDVNGDGFSDIVTGSYYGFNVSISNGDGSFQALRAYRGTGGGDVSGLSLGDFNGDGIEDVAVAFDYTSPFGSNVFIGNGDGSFRRAIGSYELPASTNMITGDFNGDGRLDIAATYQTEIITLLANGTSTSNSALVNLNTRHGALLAMTTFDQNLNRITAQLGRLGTSVSRFEVAVNALKVQAENYTAAAGRITDADVAAQSALLTGTQIIQEAAAAVLAQSNQQPALALRLLT